MRIALALCATLACAPAATAQTVEDRYGPPRPPARADRMAALTPYQGRLLHWSNKDAEAPAPLASAPVAAPEAPRASPAPMAPPPAPAPAAPPTVSRLPDSLYAPAPPAAPPARPWAAAPAPTPAGTNGAHTRLYSVHREYGLAPDAIPAPPAQASRYVLIGPPDGARARPQDDEADDSRPF